MVKGVAGFAGPLEEGLAGTASPPEEDEPINPNLKKGLA